MKITKIKTLNKSQIDLRIVAEMLEIQLNKVGFIVNSYVINSSRIDLKLHGRSFSIDTTVYGHNTSYCLGNKKRTNVPSWEQRVCFNYIVNMVMDFYGLSANIKSGAYTIRIGTKGFVETDWNEQKPEYERHNESRGFYKELGDYKQGFKNAVVTEKLLNRLEKIYLK